MKKLSLQALTVISLIGMFSSANALEKDSNTVGLWNFNEGKGTVLNDTSSSKIKLYLNKNKTTLEPKLVVTPGGKGLLFRAEDKRQFNGKAVKLTNLLTFEAWIKPVKNGKRMGLFQAMNYTKLGYRINLASNLKVNFCLDGKGHETAVNSKTALKSGEWTHIACTYDGKIAKIYINGKLDNEKKLVGYDLSNAPNTTIGYTGGTPYFNGIIDSIKISNIAIDDFTKSLASFKR